MSAALEAELDRCADGDASRPTPSMSSRTRAQRAREGTRGTTLTPARLAHTPHVGSSDKPPPSQAPPYDATTTARLPAPNRIRRDP